MKIGKLVANHVMRLNSESVSKKCWKEREQTKIRSTVRKHLLTFDLGACSEWTFPAPQNPRPLWRPSAHVLFVAHAAVFWFSAKQRKICAVVSQKGGACKGILQLAYAIFINFQLFLHSLIHENCKHQHVNKLPKMNSF